MKNKKMKKRKFIKVTIEREPIEGLLEIDDSISISDLQDGRDHSFDYFVTNLYDPERWTEDSVKVEVLKNLDGQTYPEEEMEKIPYQHEPFFVYRDKIGDYHEGVFFEEDGIESSIYYHEVSHSLSKQVFLSCPFEKTKELWNKGEIEELKSYIVPYSFGTSRKYDFEVINKIYDSRNGRVKISIRNKEHLQKRFKDGEVDEVLVDNILRPVNIKLEKQSIGETSLYVTKELLKKIESGEHKIDWNKLHSSSEIKYGLNFDCVNTGTVDKYFDTQVYDSKSSKMNSNSPSIKKILTEDGDLISL